MLQDEIYEKNWRNPFFGIRGIWKLILSHRCGIIIFFKTVSEICTTTPLTVHRIN